MAEASKWREWAQTIGDLKQWLAEHADLPDDTPIVIEKDAEGNGYSPLSAIYPGWYKPDTVGSGEARSDQYTATAEEAAADPEVRQGVEDGDLYLLGDDDARVLILGPLN